MEAHAPDAAWAAQVAFEHLLLLYWVYFFLRSIGSFAMLRAIRRASSIVSTFAMFGVCLVARAYARRRKRVLETAGH